MILRKAICVVSVVLKELDISDDNIEELAFEGRFEELLEIRERAQSFARGMHEGVASGHLQPGYLGYAGQCNNAIRNIDKQISIWKKRRDKTLEVKGLQFHIAVSFAGEDREKVEPVVNSVESRGFRVFYDKNYQEHLWGKNLYDELIDIYQKKSKFCVMFLSESYNVKRSTNHERAAAQARELDSAAEYILPVKLDAVSLPSLLPTISYIEYDELGADGVANAVVSKILSHNLP